MIAASWARPALLTCGLAIAAVLALLLGPLRDQMPWPHASVQPDLSTPPPTSPTGQSAPGAPMAAAPASGAAGPGAPASPRTAASPSFDVVRVEPNGEAVIGGRASPGSTIELMRNGSVAASVVADATGAFALTTPTLPTGQYELTLRERSPDGQSRASTQAVAVTVNPSGPPVVALVSPGQPSVLLSNPLAGTGKGSGTGASDGAAVAVELAEAEESGRLYVVGKAPPGASIRLYLNDSYLATATAGSDGRVSFSVAGGIKPGSYNVRLDQVDGAGAVTTRAEVPFTMPDTVVGRARQPISPDLDRPRTGTSLAGETATTANIVPSPVAVAPGAAVQVPEVSTRRVHRGDTLWHISRETYRVGQRYTTIYAANRDQIANPHRIYPGQVFVLPADERR